jgi:hypothetical protein
MFEFGRELRKIFGNHGRSETDPSLYELLNLKLLIQQGRHLDIEGGRVSTKDRFTPYLEAAQIWREYARRTGDPVALRRAATAAENAGKAAKTTIEAAGAALEQALTCILGSELFETYELLESAESLLAGGKAALHEDDALRARYAQAEAKLLARLAFKAGVTDLDPALHAMSRIDRAVEKADQRAQKTLSARDKIEAAQARFERGDLLMKVGLDRSDASLMAAVVKDFDALRVRLDPDYEPVTHARVVLRLAQAYIGQGQIEGRPEIISEGIALLSAENAAPDYEHSPLDWLEHTHALALGLQALSELTLNEEVYDKAMVVYDLALKRPVQKQLCVRAQLVNNRATCLAKHAEIKGDLKSLEAAEKAFKAELRGTKPGEDPVGWAVLQSNLARLYVARGDITGFMLERAEAAYALEAALEIFVEHNMKALAETTRAHLDRVREAEG